MMVGSVINLGSNAGFCFAIIWGSGADQGTNWVVEALLTSYASYVGSIFEAFYTFITPAYLTRAGLTSINLWL